MASMLPSEQKVPVAAINPAVLWTALSQKDGKLRSATAEIRRLDAAVVKQHEELASVQAAMEAHEQELRGHLRSAGHELMRLQDEVDKESKERSVHAEMVAELHKELDNRQQQLRLAGTELTRLVTAVDSSEAALVTALNEIAALRLERERQAHSAQALHQFRVERDAEAAKANADLAALDKAVLAQQAELETASQEIALLRVTLRRKEEDLSAMREQVASLEKDLHEASFELARMDAIIWEPTETGRRLRHATQMESLQAVINQQREELTASQQVEAQLRELFAAQLEQLNSSVAERDQLRREVSAKTGEVTTIDAERRRLEALLERRDRDVEAARGEASRLHGLLQHKDDDLRETADELAKAHRELGKQDTQLDDLRAEVERLKEQLEAKDEDRFRTSGFSEPFHSELSEDRVVRQPRRVGRIEAVPLRHEEGIYSPSGSGSFSGSEAS